MKIYVAGKWEESMICKDVMDILRANGHEITCDWIGHVYPEMSKEYALEDLEGVKNCDVLVALMPNSTLFYKGAWIEVGMALAFNKKVVIVGENVKSVFLGHPNVSVYKNNSLQEAISVLDIILKEK